MGSDIDPLSLVDLTARSCLANLINTVSTFDSTQLRPGLVLPKNICQKLFKVADKQLESFNETIVPIFEDTTRTRLKVLKLRSSSISDTSFKKLMKHNPIELDVHDCNKLSNCSLDVINTHGSELISLIIGNREDGEQILPETYVIEKEKPATIKPIINTPNLRRLVIWHLHSNESIWENLIQNFNSLTHLDLSNCYDIKELKFLRGAKNLVHLCLFNVWLVEEGFEVLRGLGKLRHLDISNLFMSEGSTVYPNPNELLSSIVTSMPYLNSLDISGTNLAGTGLGVEQNQRVFKCDIIGLNSRVERPLEFLGLYSTHQINASQRRHIPAKNIAGNKNERQILTACQAYMDRPEVLEKVLNDVFNLFRTGVGLNVTLGLNLILNAMSHHLRDKRIQIPCSASLYHIVKYYKTNDNIGVLLRRQILSTLIKSMEMHKLDSTMIRNGCLTICLFKIPQDVMFKYDKLIKLLMDVFTTGELELADQDGFVERVACYLLNSLVCYQVEGGHTQLVGDLGIIQKMLALIKARLERSECDDVMEIAWSTIWNVTDETVENCERFLRGNGLTLFLNCLNTFPNKPELLRSMMGVLGNVAQVSALRPKLLTRDFIQVFYTLLDSTAEDNVEVSYNAGGVLAHILLDGIEAWLIDLPITREAVLESMERNIGRWDIYSQLNINYRSFEPILHLLKISHTSVCQLWAAWTLANLTRIDPHTYCPLLEKEGGVGLLIQLASGESIVSQYTALSIDHVRQYRETGRVMVVPS